MPVFHSSISPYKMSRSAHKVVFENDYTKWTHDVKRGGYLAEAVVKNGSGKNLLIRPMQSCIGLINGSSYHQYFSNLAPADKLETFERDNIPGIRVHCGFTDENGEPMRGVKLIHEVTYHPWGYAEHTVELNVSETVNNVGMLQIGTFFVHKNMDFLAVRPAAIVSKGSYMGANAVQWIPLCHGKRRSDTPAYISRYLPVSVMFLERGVEGIELCLSDDLVAWDGTGTDIPGFQMGYISYRKALEGYEARFSLLDQVRSNQSLPAGTRRFKYRMTLPHVKKNITPLRPCSASLLMNSRGFEKRWPEESDWAAWRDAGVTLMRLHNDGDTFNNGIFWRDAAYPPYPRNEMDKMDKTLRLASKYGISAVPYFSVKEYHPEAEGFEENAQNWARLVDPRDQMIVNAYSHGVFGAQMCLTSQWSEKRRTTIETVLARHAFNGVYYDWCNGLECENPAHAQGRHWDNDALLKHLEWSHRLAGEKGEVYLHLTNLPSLAAENIASLVLTEEAGYAELTPLMFTPHVHFMNVVPRQICDMLPADAPSADRRRLAMAALLHHATISSVHADYLAFYQQEGLKGFERYKRHSAPGEGICRVSDEAAGMSLYWNDTELLAVFANFKEIKVSSEWQIVLQGYDKTGTVSLNPLELKLLRLNF